MGYSHQIFCAILFIFVLISFLNYQILMSGASLSAVNNSVERGMKEFYWVEDSSETQIKIRKVSGNDENEEKTALILEKFRLLLGLNNVHLRSPKHDHVEHGFSAPSPASSIEAEAPVPVHSHHHHPSLHPSPAQPPNKAQYGNGNKARVKRRIVIAILVSIGATLVLFVLGLILALQKLKTCCQRRYASRMVSRRGSKFENSSNSIIKVSSIPGPDLSYLDSLAPVSELEASCINHTCETLAISTKQELLKSLSDEVDGSCRKSTNAECDYVSCSSAEEILSVHARVEPIKSSSKSSSTYGSIHPELLSLDDESFHSFCDSYSSNVRLSNASEGGLSDPPNHCLREPTLPHSPTPPLTPDLEPSLYSNLHSSPESPIEIKQRTSISPSFNCLQDLLPPPPPPPTPPPPPPPPPPIFLDSPRHSDSSSGSNQGPTEYGTSSPIPTPIQSSITQLGSNGSIPPPPFPPLPPLLPTPFQKGQPPPPPQCVLPRSTPVGKNGEPLPKLKPLHWDKVRAAPDRSMVWDKLRSSSFELDEEMIESLFGYNFQSSIKNDEGMSKSSSPSRHILEPKRLQNITILLKTLNATIEQVCYALVQGDGLRLQQLEALLKMVPTKEEEAKLSNYQGNVNDLGPAERFVKMMLGIPFAFRRIEAMLYREIFEDEVVHLRKSFDILEEACKELRSSQIFLILLEAVLKTGNRMNVGTIRGGAKAFKLDALLKLADVKGTDGKTTLLHFVVQEMNRSEGIREFEISTKKSHPKVKNKTIDEREEDYRRMGLDLVSGMSAELCNVKKTATIDWDVLASSITTLSDGTIKLQHLIHKDLSMDAQSENFIHSMRSFLNHAEKSIKELQEDEDRVLSHVRDITEYFHGDVGKHEANPLEIFMIVGDFLAMLDEVCKELRSLKTPSGQNSVAPFR